MVRVSTLPADGGPPTLVSPPDLNIGGGATLNRDATVIAFAHSWSEKAPEAYVARLQPFAATQVSHVQTIEQLAQAPLGRTEVIQWKAPDGLSVEGLLTYPAGYTKGSRVPLVVIVHGGPTGVFTQSFVGMPNPYPIPVFAARGYAVLRCNVRGSSGTDASSATPITRTGAAATTATSCRASTTSSAWASRIPIDWGSWAGVTAAT